MVAKPRTENMQRMAREQQRIAQRMAIGGGGEGRPKKGPRLK